MIYIEVGIYFYDMLILQLVFFFLMIGKNIWNGITSLYNQNLKGLSIEIGMQSEVKQLKEKQKSSENYHPYPKGEYGVHER